MKNTQRNTNNWAEIFINGEWVRIYKPVIPLNTWRNYICKSNSNYCRNSYSGQNAISFIN